MKTVSATYLQNMFKKQVNLSPSNFKVSQLFCCHRIDLNGFHMDFDSGEMLAKKETGAQPINTILLVFS